MSKANLILKSVRFLSQVYLGPLPYSVIDAGSGHISPGSKIQIDVNEKQSSIHITVSNDKFLDSSYLTIVPMTNVICMVYAADTLKDGEKK
jgi:hypothetical protein